MIDAQAINIDSVGDAFYRDIIQPMREESSKMSTAMEDLTSALYRIKEEIDYNETIIKQFLPE